MRKFNNTLRTVLLLFMAGGLGGCAQDASDASAPAAKVLLELSTSHPQSRTLDETTIEDLNIFFYVSLDAPVYHFYIENPGTEIPVELKTATYSVCAVANVHEDLGEMNYYDLESLCETMPEDGTLPFSMFRHIANVDPSTVTVPIVLERSVAKVNYNITLADTARDIVLTSVSFCSVPRKLLFFENQERLSEDAADYHDVCILTSPGTQQTLSGSFIMPENPQGEVPTIADQKHKSPAYAPKFATYMLIRGYKGNKALAFYIYPGANVVNDFNVLRNQEHTLAVNILNDSEVDTRIVGYSLNIEDSWLEQGYNRCDEREWLDITIATQNMTSLLTISGKVSVLEGATGLDIDQYENQVEMDLGTGLVANKTTTYDLRYNSALVPLSSKNNSLTYRVTVSDNQGGELSASLTRKFANTMRAQCPVASGTVAVSKALQTLSTSTTASTMTVGGLCLEDGCTFIATPKDGYQFEGWYADAACTQLLSRNAEYHRMPEKAVEMLYTKWGYSIVYKVAISSSESNKNKTYMYNTNAVSLVSENYSGKVNVKISDIKGGVICSGAISYAATLTAGTTTPLGNIVFAPTAVGQVSYTITVLSSDGFELAAQTVMNTVTATTLVPTISLDYGSPLFVESYIYQGANTSWYGSSSVEMTVAFSPVLDYPYPDGGKPILEVECTPTAYVFELGTEEYYDGDPDYVEPMFYYVWKNSDMSKFPSLTTAEVLYSTKQQNYAVATAASGMIFNPHTEGKSELLLPSPRPSSNAPKMQGYMYGLYRFQDTKQQVSLINKLTDSALTIETNIDKIAFMSNLDWF